MTAAVASSLRALRIRPSGLSGVSAESPSNQRHHGHAGFETAEAQRQLGKEQDADADGSVSMPVPSIGWCEMYHCPSRQVLIPGGDRVGMRRR